MRRGIIIALAFLGVLVIILLVAVASVGSNLDQARIERDDLQTTVDDLQVEVDDLTAERDRLQKQVGTMEQWKAELERTHAGQAGQPAPASQAPSAQPASPEPSTP